MDSHLSRPYVAIWLKPPFEAHRANVSLRSALLRIGFAGPHSLLCAGELLPRLSTLTVTAVRQPYRSQRRYISVALSLGSPPAAVSRYPALWSSDFPHAESQHATARSAHGIILKQNRAFVNEPGRIFREMRSRLPPDYRLFFDR